MTGYDNCENRKLYEGLKMRHKIITIMLLGVLTAAAPISALAADAKVSADKIAFAADVSQIDEKAAGEEDNTLADGWKKIGPYWYYYEGGKPAVGWKLISGKWYFFATNGRMIDSWLYRGDCNYYLGPGGDMAVGWKQIHDSWYYFDEDGVMQTDWQKIGDKWYYFETSGKMRTGWLHSAGCTFYLNPAGDMVIGWKEVDSEWYYFDDNGAAVTDWLLSGGKWFYFDYIDYTMETGSREIDGVNYNFREDGSLIE